MKNRLVNMAAKAVAGPDSAVTRTVERLPGLATNVGQTERVVSMLAGGLLLTKGLSSRGSGLLSLVTGGMLLYRGISGNCQLYRALGLDTSEGSGPNTAIPAGHGVRIDEAIVVNRPASELYEAWRQLENLPQILDHIRDVRPTSEYQSHWVAHGPFGISVEWDAEITNDTKDEVIAWRSLEGSDIDTAGSVHFRAQPGGEGTEVRVNLKYDPPAGRVGIAIAKIFGTDPQTQIREDLARFKEQMESRDPT